MRLAFLLALAPALAAAQPAAKPSPTDLVPLGPTIAGLPGYAVVSKPSKLHCGSLAIDVTPPKRRPTTEPALVAVLDLRFPTGLNFDPDPSHQAAREKSLQRFNAFVQQLGRLGQAATRAYEPKASGTTEASFAAAARLVQVRVHVARLLRYAEIPKDVRSGEFAEEKTMAFCDKLEEVSEPIDESARAAYDKCHAGVAQFPNAWWAPVCAN
jgi:hypothetical protein